MNKLIRFLVVPTLLGVSMSVAHAAQYVWDAGGAYVDLLGITQLAELGTDVKLVNGTWTKADDFDYGKTLLPALTFGAGATVNVRRISMQNTGTSDKTRVTRLTVEQGAVLNMTGDGSGYNSYVNDGRVETDEMIIDGGVVDSKGTLNIANPGQSGKATDPLTGTVKIRNGGSLTVKNGIGVAVRIGYEGTATSGYSVSTLDVDGGNLTTKKIVINAKANNKYSKGASSTIRFANGAKVAIGDLYGYQYGKISVTLDDCEIGTMVGITDKNFFFLKNIGADGQTCQLGSGGVTFCITNDYSGKLIFGMSASGTGAFRKRGLYDLTFREGESQTFSGPMVCEEGNLFVPTAFDTTDLRAEGGVIDLTGATPPAASKITLTMSNAGYFQGLSTTDTYAKLVLGEGAAVPMTFDANGCTTPLRASVINITATKPVSIRGILDGVGGLQQGVDYVIFPIGMKPEYLDRFQLIGCAGDLFIENGALIARAAKRTVGVVTWAAGSSGASWWAAGSWNFWGSPTTFLSGDTAVFENAGGLATVDGDVSTAKLRYDANAKVVGSSKIYTPEIEVKAGVSGELVAPVGQHIVKTGEGELVLTDFASKQRVDIRNGQVTLKWSGEPTTDPFDVEVVGSTSTNVLAGVLDLGGATQTFRTARGLELFKTGGGVRNGKLYIDFTDNWWPLTGAQFTVGKGAECYTLPGSDVTGTSRGEMNFQAGAKLTVDGGYFCNQNRRSGSAGHHIGVDAPGTAEVRVVNGGEFHSKHLFVRVGMNSKATGILSADGGTVNIADGKADLRVATGDSEGNQTATGIVALTNGTLKAAAIWLAENTDGNTAKLNFKDSHLYINKIYESKQLTADSFVKFDGATIHPQQGGSFMPTLQFPYTLENRGLTIDCGHDSSITGQLTGKGPLIKEGSAVLVMSGDNTGHTGGIEVRGGSLSLTNEVLKLASGTKFVGYTGAMLTIAYRDDGFVTRDCGIDLKVAGEGTFDLDIKAIGTPAEGSTYVLFKSGATADMLDRLSITPGYVLAVDGGKLVVTINATALRWVGNSPGDNRWTSVSNWDPSRVPGLSDRIIFERDDAFTTLYDLDSEVKLGSITVNRGAWTTDVGESAMTGPALAVEAGASFTMVNADGRKNMFSVAKNANYVAGLLDIGGAEQLISSDMSADQGLFRSGGEVRNGTYTINAVSWFRLNGVRDFTIGRNALVILPKQTSTVGQMNLHNANLRIDGGELRALNATSVSNSGGYIGNGGDATIEVVNGGVFAHTGKFGVLGYAVDGPGNGRILADNGTVNFGSRELFLGNTANSVGELRMTNSTLTCTSFTIGFSRELGEGEEIGPQIAEFVGSTLNIDHMTARRTNENTRVIFDGAMIYENGKQVELLPDIGVPYRLRGSGLTVRAYRTHERIELGGAFVGDGGIALESGGAKTTAALTGDDERRLEFTGALSVGKDVSLLATNKVFAGSLRVLSGGKANVRDSLFEGDVYVEDGATFEGVEERRYDEPLTLVTAVGKITIDPTLRERSDSFGNVYYVAVRRGRNVLCYGRDSGLVIRMR